MWTLWIISSVIESTEPKYTAYTQYNTLIECCDSQRELKKEFTQGEIAFCKGPENQHKDN